ncbi:MAG: hypothetical protein K6356_16035 [Chloroflexus sp.]
MYYHYHHRQCYRQQIDSQRQRITTMDRLEQCAPFIAIANYSTTIQRNNP